MQRFAALLLVFLFLHGCAVHRLDGNMDPGAQQTAEGGQEDAPPEVLGLAIEAGMTRPDEPRGPISAATTQVPAQASPEDSVETVEDVRRTGATDAGDELTGVERDWVIEKGDTLENGLRRWAGEAGIALQWDVPRIFPILARIELQGNFEYAFSRVMEAYALAENPVYFDYGLYANRVLRVTLKGDASR